jgi:DNA-binding NtrC family response regulator
MREAGRLLIVDDERVVRDSLSGWLREDGHDCRTASSGEDALELVGAEPFDLCVVDLKMPRGMDGLETMHRLRALRPDTDVVIITAYATVDTAVQAMKDGAADYLVKPFEPEELSAVVERILTLRRMRHREPATVESGQVVHFHGMVSRNSRMHEIFHLVREVADLRSTVLVEGESGTGKELVARAIHREGRRKSGPYLQLSCASLPETLLESELFGYEKGAFTGAFGRRAGKFELASGGTLLLDEISDIGPRVQADLLRVLQERRIFRLGGTEDVSVDVRFVAATNRPLLAAVQEGRFREDLFYRLNVIRVCIPPLRDRMDDLDLLVRDLVVHLASDGERPVPEIAPGVVERLAAHTWPGNVRELENAVERAMVSCKSNRLEARDFDFMSEPGLGEAAWIAPSHLSLREVESEVIRSVLRRTAGNVSEAATILGIDRSTLYDKMKRYNIDR